MTLVCAGSSTIRELAIIQTNQNRSVVTLKVRFLCCSAQSEFSAISTIAAFRSERYACRHTSLRCTLIAPPIHKSFPNISEPHFSSLLVTFWLSFHENYLTPYGLLPTIATRHTNPSVAPQHTVITCGTEIWNLSDECIVLSTCFIVMYPL